MPQLELQGEFHSEDPHFVAVVPVPTSPAPSSEYNRGTQNNVIPEHDTYTFGAHADESYTVPQRKSVMVSIYH